MKNFKLFQTPKVEVPLHRATLLSNYRSVIKNSFITTILMMLGLCAIEALVFGHTESENGMISNAFPLIIVAPMTCCMNTVKAYASKLNYMIPSSPLHKYLDIMGGISLFNLIMLLSLPAAELVAKGVTLLLMPGYDIHVFAMWHFIWQSILEDPILLVCYLLFLSFIVLSETLVRHEGAKLFVNLAAIVFISLYAKIGFEAQIIAVPVGLLVVIANIVFSYRFFKKWQPANNGILMI